MADRRATEHRLDTILPALRIPEGECVYDFAWHPRMAATDPTTSLLASTSRAHPVHLWDACTGALRASYRSHDAADEPEAAFSVAFTPDGSRIFCGYSKYIRIFDLEQPGRHHSGAITTAKARSFLCRAGAHRIDRLRLGVPLTVSSLHDPGAAEKGRGKPGRHSVLPSLLARSGRCG